MKTVLVLALLTMSRIPPMLQTFNASNNVHGALMMEEQYAPKLTVVMEELLVILLEIAVNQVE